MSEGIEARRYLRARRHGILSTISRKFEGYPFGSVATYVLDHEGRPVILISRLAEHSRNIEADPRVSLLVSDAGEDAQASARLTLIGHAACAGGDLGALHARYLKYRPDAQKLLALGDFSLWTITPRALRFIGGFGDIRWITAASYAPPANALAEREDDIITHMNTEHAHGLRDCCRYYHRRNTEIAIMVGIDCDGFDVRADGGLLRFDFDLPVTDATAAREQLVAMARNARGA